MSSALQNHFVKPLTDFYGRNPFGDGFVKRLEPYAKTLSGEVLEAVATRLIERGGKSFPSFLTCKIAIEQSERAMSAPVSTGLKPWQHQEGERLDFEAKKQAWKLCRGEMGRTASQEGWLQTLVEFCADKARLPNEREVRDLKAFCQKVDDNLHAEPRPAFYKNLCEWRQAMKDRAHEDVFGFYDKHQEAAE
jgi:hypothetical protein